MNRKYIICSILGCIFFGIGDWLLGYVDPTPVKDAFYFISEGHGNSYEVEKATATLVLASVGMFFFYIGLSHTGDIAKDEKWRRLLNMAFAFCSVGWLIIHFVVAVNVAAFSWASKNVSQAAAAELSKNMSGATQPALYIAYLMIIPSLVLVIIAIAKSKTVLSKKSIAFSPIVGMALLDIISVLLPSSAFSKGLYTFCMNGGLLIWYIYLLATSKRSVHKN